MGRVRVRVQILVLVLARNLGLGLGGDRDRDRALGGVAACTMGPSLLEGDAILTMLCLLCLHDGPVPPEGDAVELPLEREHREGGERRLTQRGHAQGLEIGVRVRVGLE